MNVPGNPTGALGDLGAAAAWGRAHGVPVLSDECYVEFTWEGPARTILEHGTDGVLAVHSLSKRSNLAGARAGFYAGDAELVSYLSEVRKHAGFMVPGPVQAAAVAAWGDDDHVDEQRTRYLTRLEAMAKALSVLGIDATLPAGSFYLWVPAPDGDAWGLARQLAERGGVLVSPGDFYGPDGAGHVRIAVVQPDDRIALAAARWGGLDLSVGPWRCRMTRLRSLGAGFEGRAQGDEPIVDQAEHGGQAGVDVEREVVADLGDLAFEGVEALAHVDGVLCPPPLRLDHLGEQVDVGGGDGGHRAGHGVELLAEVGQRVSVTAIRWSSVVSHLVPSARSGGDRTAPSVRAVQGGVELDGAAGAVAHLDRHRWCCCG